LTLINTANGPFPDGDPVDPNTSGQVMQFRVNQRLAGTDRSFNPAAPATSLRRSAIVDIKPTAQRPADAQRQLVLVEVEGEGGPEMVLLNNSHWDGLRDGTTTPIPGSTTNGAVSATETPRVGSTEIWEIANLSEDAHPIHLHLVQFQAISRRHFDRDGYRAAWDAQFPGGTFAGVTYAPGEYIPGFGPPTTYTTPNADGALGGNLALSGFFDSPAANVDANERGWKDTLRMNPFEVTRIAVRFAYEYRDDSGQWYRAYGNENWQFAADGLMELRLASINEHPIAEAERKFHWPLGRRPDDHASLSELGL